MDDPWTDAYADELARCLADARRCADACETYLVSLPHGSTELQDALDALAAPAAVARTLVELVDRPLQLVVAAARLLHELACAAAAALRDPPEVVAALRVAAESSARLVAAVE